MEQFKHLQEVVILGLLVHGERVDSNGRFIGYKISGPLAGQVEVEVNTIRLHFPVDRVVDAKEYWDKKHGRS